MPNIRFNISHYPNRHRFSDPYFDFDGDEARLAAIAAKPPRSLSQRDLLHIFNSWLPAGTFEEMVPYIPRALELIWQEADENPGEALEVLQALICWSHVEQAPLTRDATLLRDMQGAFMALFCHWTSQLAWRPCTSCGSGHLIHAILVEAMLFYGDECAKIGEDYRAPVPWLSRAHYLPLLAACDTVPHAAWALHTCLGDLGDCFKRPGDLLPADTILKAIDMVETWLLSPDASEVDVAIWDGLLCSIRMKLPYTPSTL